jgi:hypothetical protein
VRLLFLSLVLLTCAAPTAAQDITEKEQMGLKGPVKTVRTKWFKSVQGGPAGEVLLFENEVTLDREGRQVEKLYYEPDGRLWRREVFTYDAAGRTEVSYNPDGTAQQRVVRQKEEFDKERRSSRMVVTSDSGGFYYETVTKYDARGRWVERSGHDRDGKLKDRGVMKYGADGGFVEFLHYNSAGVVLQRHVRVPEGMKVFTYDNGGALVSTETRRRQVCTESDSYGNCKREMMTKSVSKAGGVEEVTELILRTYTYY